MDPDKVDCMIACITYPIILPLMLPYIIISYGCEFILRVVCGGRYGVDDD
jgi:hypothetical protein